MIDLNKRPETRSHLAIPGIIVASIFNASMGACVKLSLDHLSIEALTFWRNFISLLLFFPWVLWLPPRGNLKEKLKVTHWKMVAIRSITGLASVVLFFYSLKSLSLSDSLLLVNTMPIFIPFVAYFWKGFPIFHRLWWGIGSAFIGLVFILTPGSLPFHWATLSALTAGLLAAVAMIALRMSHYSEPSYRTIFYTFLICASVMGLATLFNFEKSWHALTLPQAMLVISIGILGLLYQTCITWAAKHGPMRLISSFTYSGVVFSALLDYWIWNNYLSLSFYLGFFFIVLGAILITVLYPKKDM